MSITKQVNDIIDLVQQHETAPDWALTMKLSEECGEFSEAMLKELGFLQHKVVKEGTFGEAADVIIVVLSALAKHYPLLEPSTIVDQLSFSMREKTGKYKRILGVNEE